MFTNPEVSSTERAWERGCPLLAYAILEGVRGTLDSGLRLRLIGLSKWYLVCISSVHTSPPFDINLAGRVDHLF
jgi:hypothetical protein